MVVIPNISFVNGFWDISRTTAVGGTWGWSRDGDSTNQVRTVSPLLSVMDLPTRSSVNPPIGVRISIRRTHLLRSIFWMFQMKYLISSQVGGLRMDEVALYWSMWVPVRELSLFELVIFAIPCQSNRRSLLPVQDAVFEIPNVWLKAKQRGPGSLSHRCFS